MSGTRAAAGGLRRLPLLVCAALVGGVAAGCGDARMDAERDDAAGTSSAATAAPDAPPNQLDPIDWGTVDLPAGVTAELVAEGRAVFLGDGLCHICHGTEATGERGIGANLTDGDWWHSDGSYEAIVEQVRTGVTSDQVRNELGAVMPPRGGSSISDGQVRAVAAYVWSLRLRPGA